MPHLSSVQRKTILKQIFNALFAAYGPQHWWPAETPFEIAIGAILTQNTNWRNVEIAIDCLKQHQCLSPGSLFHISEAKLSRLVRSSGFHNIKARRVKEFVKFLMRSYGGKIGRMRRKRVSSLRQELLRIKGIGPETCDSILLYAVGKPVFVVDGYTKRILSRHGLIDKRATYDDVRAFFEGNLEKDAKLFNEYHALLVRLAKERCTANDPLCNGCPLGNIAPCRDQFPPVRSREKAK